MKNSLFLSVAAAMILAAGPAVSSPDKAVVGQKLDSGLGSLPHYSKWADPTGRNPVSHKVAGESLDDGVGSLPHYSKWLDRTGRDPMGREVVRLSAVTR
ncbi:MAG: hypothetical protein Q8L92_06715 [Rubrivivax sp.]|nr:hypothetical protein [Rubrivivax sp.]